MGRSAFLFLAVLILSILILSITGCSSSSAINTTNYPVPASVSISPTPSLSLEVGTYQAFTASMFSSAKTAITEPVFYLSSNTAVVTVAANGLACAGSWDNLSSPQICTPGPIGVAQVRATAQGVTSAPTTIYVHQHIDNVTLADVCAVAQPPAPCTVPRYPCQSLNQNSLPQNTVYEARAYSRGTDVTSSVGQFMWQAVNSGVVTLSNTSPQLSNVVNGVSLNQVEATAQAPGISPVFATVGNTISVSANFTTCRVQSITLETTASSTTSATITPTVTDFLGNLIMFPGSTVKVPLTWSSSQPASVTVSTSGATSASSGGAATVIASCTPPTCNIGFFPTQPIYPENAVEIVGNSSGSSTSSSSSATVYISSTGCETTDNCVSTIVPLTASTNVLGAAIGLPATPNSLVFDRQGAKAYIGTHSGLLGSKGLMVLPASSNAVSQFSSAPGKVLAVSPDGTKVVVSDTTDTPNQVFIFDTTASASTPLSITGATAADFSPDSLKAYIIAGSTLYVYSKLDALQTIPLAAPARDVSFFAEGAFAYLAGGDPAGVLVRRTCDNGQADTVATPATPTFIRALANATQVLALSPPIVDLINVTATPTGCTPSVSNSVTSFDLGHGNFTASQLIVSESGSTAYVISPTLSSVLVVNIGAETSSSLALLGNTNPLQASLSPDGNFLFVGASDGMVHTIQTATGVDVAQVPFPLGLCQNTAGNPFVGITCNPDLIAVKP